MTPYAQLPTHKPEEFLRTVGLSREAFLHLHGKAGGLPGRPKSPKPDDKTGTERLLAGFGRPLVADTLVPSPLSYFYKSGGDLRYQ